MAKMGLLIKSKGDLFLKSFTPIRSIGKQQEQKGCLHNVVCRNFDRIQWLVDGNVVRTKTRNETKGEYPSSPA